MPLLTSGPHLQNMSDHEDEGPLSAEGITNESHEHRLSKGQKLSNLLQFGVEVTP